jgi:hypothetical protein
MQLIIFLKGQKEKNKSLLGMGEWWAQGKGE